MKWLYLLLLVIFCPAASAVCPEPVIPEHGYLADLYDGDGDSYIKYACSEGYELDGHEENFCAGSSWQLEVPLCKASYSCPVISTSDIPNAQDVRTEGDGTSYGSKVIVICFAAYIRDPDVRESECTTSGTWDPPIPACIVPMCLIPSSTGLKVTIEDFYQRNADGTKVEQSAIAYFSCAENYVMNPKTASSATCLASGNWDRTIPTCTGKNVGGTITVDVPSTHTTVELALVNVTCTATSTVNTTLYFRWLYDGNSSWELSGSQLELREVRAVQAGMYHCEVRTTNPPDSATASMELIVHFSPRWQNHAVTKFALTPPDPVALICQTRALPEPSFFWQQNSVNLTNGGKYQITSSGNVSTLTIGQTSSSDLGVYHCVGHNVAGTGRFTLQVLEPGIPEAPMYCAMSNVSAYAAVIDCIPGYKGGEELDFAVYKYAINIGQEPVDSEFEMNGDMAFITVMDLQPNSNYTILIYQQNRHGQSEASMGVYIVTEDGIPIFPDDPLPVMIIVGAVCGGVLLIFLVVLTAVLCRRHRRNRTPKAPQPHATIAASAKDSNEYMMEDTAGFGEPSRRLSNNGVIGMENRAYKANSLTSIDQQRISYENAPTLPRPYTLNIGHQPGESQVGMDNSGYASDQGSNVTEYSSVMERRQMADPIQRAHRLSADQPSLAGMGALSMLPDPCAVRQPPMRTSVSPATTPTIIGATPSFQPQVPWEFPRERLFVRTRLGEGSFGEVWRARADGICGRQGKTQVAVKMLKEYSTPEERRALLKELEVMKVLQPHPNIIQLLGCCTQSEPICIIMDLAQNGSLETVLRSQRRAFSENNLSPENSSRLRARDLVIFCIHVASAMEYISAKNLLHRDLAARNVLVDDAMICKVCDFGSARDIAQMRQYESRTQRRLPLRWMAPESLLQCTYSTASDIWSFGILMWEILTLGSTPYPGMSGPEVMAFVQKGCRMNKPPHCSEAMYALMKDTWQQFPQKRPQFSLVRHRLLAILDEPQHDISIADMEDNAYQIVSAQPGEKC